jgi:hypothetical protein
MATLPPPLDAFAATAVTPARQDFLAAIVEDAISAGTDDYRQATLKALGYSAPPPPAPVSLWSTNGVPPAGSSGWATDLPDISQRDLESAASALTRSRRAQAFRAGLAGRGCLVGLRQELSKSVAARQQIAWKANARKTAEETNRQMAALRHRARLATVALLIVGVLSCLLACVMILAGDQSPWPGLLGVGLPGVALIPVLLISARVRALAGRRPAPPGPPPTFELLDQASGRRGRAGRQRLRDQLLLIGAGAYEGAVPVDAHQALVEIKAALDRLERPLLEPELTLPAAFADALIACACATMPDLHPPLFEGLAPVGDALGLELYRDPAANTLTLRWREQPDEDPFVMITALRGLGV